MTTNDNKLIAAATQNAVGTILLLNVIAKQTYGKTILDLTEQELRNIQPVVEQMFDNESVDTPTNS